MRDLSLLGDLDGMRQALDDEVAAVATQRRRFVLVDGIDRNRSAGHAIVEFPSVDVEGVEEGQEADLFVGRQQYQAEILELRRTSLVLLVRASISVVGVVCRLEVDNAALVRQLRRRLDAIAADEWFDGARADNLLNQPAQVQAPQSLGTLNDRQAQAVSTALTPGTTFLWGPPGTGKTTTVAHTVVELVKAGLSVLVVSHTNAAVDLALIRAADALKARELLSPGVIVRSGSYSSAISDAHSALLTVAGTLTAQGSTHTSDLVRVRQAIEQCREKRSLLDPQHQRDDVKRWDQRLVELEDAAESLRLSIRHLESAVLREAQVLGTTAHRAACGRLERTFEAVVIDEASMVSIPTAWLCLGLARTHALIAGDFRQLPPIVVAETARAEKFLGRSLFEHASTARNAASPSAPGLVALTVQHRMTQAVARLVDASFYPEIQLQTAPDVLTRTSAAFFSDLPVVAALNISFARSFRAKRGSQFNPVSAQLFAGLVLAAERDRPITRQSLLAVSPYRAQSALLQKVAHDLAGTALREPIGSTVHRAQGDEASSVYFDVTEARAVQQVGRWFQGTDVNDDTSRLMNVAFSRAKDQLVVAGAVRDLIRKMPAGRPKEALAAVSHHASDNFMDHLQAVDDPRFEILSSDIAERVASDLTQSSTSVAFYLSHLDEAVVDEVRALRHDVPSGVLRRVTAGISAGQSWRNWSLHAEELRIVGYEVDLRSPMELDAVVVDETVLWTFDRVPFARAVRGIRTALRSFASETVSLLRTKPPTVAQPGRQSDECRQCGRTRALVDTFFGGVPDVRLFCPVCDRAMERAFA